VESDRPPIPLDVPDQQLAQALQIDGRAPFRRIADVLGVSDQTVARRYARLRTGGVLRVLGLTDPLRSGGSEWFVRVHCTPDAAGSISQSLARREDTTWVNLTSGGTEISCLVRSDDDAADHLLLARLPRTPRVTDVQAHAVLHVFFGQELAPISKTGPLTAAQVRALYPEDAPDGSELGRPLDDAERRLTALLARDGRAQLADLAAATGWSQSTVRRRMSELRRTGVLYFDLELGLRIVNSGMRADLWLDVEPSRLAGAGAALAEHPQVSYAAATTGSMNLYACVSCGSAGEFYRYLTGDVSAVPGIRRSVTAPVLRTIKGPGPYWPSPLP